MSRLSQTVVIVAILLLVGCHTRCPQDSGYGAAAEWLDSQIAGEANQTYPREILVPEAAAVCWADALSMAVPAPAEAGEILDLMTLRRPGYVLANEDVAWDGVRSQRWFSERYQPIQEWHRVYPEPLSLTLFAYTPTPFDLGVVSSPLGGFNSSSVALSGYRLSSPRVEPSVPLYLSLFWDDLPGGDYQDLKTTIRLVAKGSDKLWYAVEDSLEPSGLWWQPENRLARRYTILPPDDLPQGVYELRVGIRERNGRPVMVNDGEGRDATEMVLAEVTHPPDVSLAPIASDFSAAYRFGGVDGPISLVGYDSPPWCKAGSDLHISLLWSARGDVSESYQVFVHMLSLNGALVAQSDGVPVYGFYPTVGWKSGDFIRDTHVLSLPVDLPAGDYRLTVGLYSPETGIRQTVQDSQGRQLSSDQAVLHELVVYPAR